MIAVLASLDILDYIVMTSRQTNGGYSSMKELFYHWPSQLTPCLTLDRRRTWAHLSLLYRGV